MKHLTAKHWPVAVTLRSSGKLIARNIRADRNTAGSLLAAALDAMRSSRLPDRITPSLLASLTVEVEIIGTEAAVSLAKGNSSVVTGLTGLKLSNKTAKAYALGSTAYQLALSPRQMQGFCISQISGDKRLDRREDRWTVFRTRHYVGYPDGKVVQLYRGKTLMPPAELTPDALAGAASAVGLFLVRHQDSDGFYRVAGRRGTLDEHLYATYAMAKLARRDGQKLFTVSLNRAMACGAKYVRVDDRQARVLPGPSGGPQIKSPIRATAWLLMTLTELPPKDRGAELAGKLAGALRQDVVAVVGPDHGIATPDQLVDWSIALLALRKALANDQAAIKALEPIGRTIRAWSSAKLKLSPWVLRAAGPTGNLPGWTQLDDSDLPDRRGGFLTGGSEPATLDTALAAVCLIESLRSSPPPAADDAAAIRKRAGRARQFCFQMLYRSREAYTVTKPLEMIGGVRARPDGAPVSLEACAAAIEAFLAK